MNCQRVADDEIVERYLNGQLEPALQDDFEVHILECPHCRARAETLSAARAGLAQRAHEIRLLPARAARRLRLAWLGIAAALIAACALGFYELRSTAHQSPAQTGGQTQAPQPGPVKPAISQEASVAPHAASGAQSPAQKQPVTATTSKKPEVVTPVVGQGANPEQAQNAPPSTATNSQVAAEQQSNPAAGVSASDFAAKHRTSPTQMSEEQAVELYSLATVQPPSYAFSGLAVDAKLPDAGAKPSGLSQGFTATSTGRALFQIGMVAYVEKRYAAAADSLQTVLEGEPRAADANFYLGICRLMQGRPNESIAPLKTVLVAPIGTLTQSAHFYLAKAYLQISNLAQAEEEMQAAAAMPGRLTAEARSLAARIQALRKSKGSQENVGPQKPN
ncbi:MAG: hypothetical protein DMG67_04300 [Acidobacteria bacterium]|nr:MAG: hypothetical protein DMG67_04300 [Acidobacteriota bacterium]